MYLKNITKKDGDYMRKAKKLLKKVLVGVSVVGVLISTDAMAASRVTATFSQAKVDSNSYSTIAKIVKKKKFEFAYVNIDEIYKADGSSSNYKRIKGKVEFKDGKDWSNCGTEKTIQKGIEQKFAIPKAGREAGTTLRFRAMGNDPSLDCRITGSFESY